MYLRIDENRIRLFEFFVCAFISTLLFLRDVLSVGISSFMFIFPFVFLFLIGNKSSVYCFLAFLTPLSSGLPYAWIAGILLCFVLIRYGFRLETVSFLLLICLLVLELFLGIRFAPFDFNSFLRFSIIFLFSFLFMLDCKGDYEYLRIVRFYLIGYIVAIMVLLGQLVSAYSISGLLSAGIRLGDVNGFVVSTAEASMQISFNPNYLGELSILAMMIGIFCFKTTKKKQFLFISLMSVLIGALTQSRAFLIVFFLALFVLMFSSFFSLKEKIRLIILLCIVFLNFILFFEEYFISIIRRWNVTDISNGRTGITEGYFYELCKSLDRFLFGVGLQNYQAKYDFYWSAHNATQEVLLAWGFLGLLVVTGIMISIFYNAKNNNKNMHAIQTAPFILCLIYMQSGQGFSIFPNMLQLMVAYSASQISWVDNDNAIKLHVGA